MLARLALRPAAAALHVASSAPKPCYRAFSSTRNVLASGDRDLYDKLSEELSYEKENSPQSTPAYISEFRNTSGFEIKDTPGDSEVTLVKKHGDEQIQVAFSVEDIVNAETAYDDEADDEDQAFPVTTVVTVTNTSNPELGAITFHTTCETGSFHIDNVTYGEDAALAVKDTAEADYARRGQYVGPIFDDLDERLQDSFYSYLKARGVNERLGEFIPAYVEYKEQQEYTRWLEKVREFTKP
ncbi:Mitochondrial acidic protein mam33 [Sorochytrium milnesiophthora]